MECAQEGGDGVGGGSQREQREGLEARSLRENRMCDKSRGLDWGDFVVA